MSLVNYRLTVKRPCAGVEYRLRRQRGDLAKQGFTVRSLGATRTRCVSHRQVMGLRGRRWCEVNLPMLGASDTLTLQAVYAKGASSCVSPELEHRRSVQRLAPWA